MKYYLRRNSHRIIKALICIILIGTSLFALRYFLNSRGEVVTSGDETAEDFSPDKVVALRANILNFGSISWATDGTNPQTPSLSALDSFSRSQYDAWIANLGCPLSEKRTADICDIGLLATFADKFNAVALGGLSASDGSRDEYTTGSLIKNNIQYFGRTANDSKPDDCEVLSLPARFELNDGSFKQATIPLVLCGVNGEKTLNTDIISEIKKYAEWLPVWVYALDSGNASGIEKQTQYRSYIDSGADLVLGVADAGLGTSEAYANSLIIYSLGRFLGDVGSATKNAEAALLAVEINAPKDESAEWEKIANTCSGHNDLCLEAAISQSLKKPNYGYSFSIVAVDSTDSWNPKTADSTLSLEVLGNLNWFETSEKLKAGE